MLLTEILYGMFLFIALVLLIEYHWKKRRLYKLAWSLNGPISLPIIGDALHVFCKDEEILENATRIIHSYPSPIKFWFGPKLVVIFSKTKQIEKIMSSMIFANKNEVYRFIKVFNGEGMITASGPKWKRDRRLITPFFTAKKVEKYFPVCTEQCDILIDALKEKVGEGTFNVKKYINRCSADITTESLLGIKPQAQTGTIDVFLETVSRIYVLVHSRISKVWFQNDFIFKLLGYGKIQDQYKNIIQDFFRDSINLAKARYIEEKNSHDQVHSVIYYLLKIREEIPSFSTDEELIHHISTFYSAAEDTLTVIVSFTLVLLGMYPKIQEKIVDELKRTFGLKPRNVELEDLSQLSYMLMCIKDVMRLFPIAPFIMREASEDCNIDGWTIPKGCSVMVSIYSLHRSPEHWEKPNEFYPEHFLPEAVIKRHPYSFIPFSAGIRGCIGKPFAYMAIQTILASILQHYKIEADGKLQDKQLRADISTRFKDDIYPIRIKKRIY